MALFAYLTDECRKEATEFSNLSDLENLCKQIEESQDFSRFDPFPPPYLVRKHFAGRNGRLVAVKQSVTCRGEEHTVIVLLSVIMRSNRAYKEFSENAAEYGARHFAKRFSLSDLENDIEKRMTSDPVTPKPALSEDEYGYLYEAISSNNDNANDLICESADWEETIGKESFKPSLTRVYDSLGSAQPAATPGGSLIDIPQKPGWKILARSFPSLNTWFLAALLTGSSDEEERLIRRKYSAILEAEEVDLQLLLKHSRRSYPQLILAAEELWQKVQSDKLANLALSPEETEILKTALKPEGAFPLFINGRAGSGKSTILQYLFADYLFYHVKTGKTGAPPVYFTYNEELLKDARQVVESVLDCSTKYWDHLNHDLKSERVSGIVDQAFWEFRRYLLSLVPEKARKQRFVPAKRIDYSGFRNLWFKKPGRTTLRRDITPDLCWHIIRTYIKGTSPDTFLDADEYCQLDQNHRTVSPEVYKLVYQNVWESWYKEKTSADSGYWDDQDLVRYVLDHDLIQSVFPCIFCDEAQDFTRVELEAIRRMSLFSERTVEPPAIAHIPFVFAGDQFQTVNPTGFRWDGIKAWFVEKFIFALDPNRKSGLNDINYHELGFNYRSTAPIVGFSNYVQALRGYLFDLPDVKPQISWDSSPAHPVSYFQINQDFFWEGLQKLSGVVLILPCHENEEDWFIDNDPVLRDKIRTADGRTLIPVLSPVRAKGREFTRVVLYGFGKDCPDQLLDPLRKPDCEDFSQEESLPLEYFLNRLYVAVSRAKQQLIIVDADPIEKSKLWVFANNPDFEDAILKRVNGRNEWDQRLKFLENGRREMLTASNPTDGLENARGLEESGLRQSDAFLLQQAAIAYKNCGDDAKANFCRAWEYRLYEKYSEAGEIFLGIGYLNEAVECYWMAGKKGWPEMVAKCKDAASRIEYQLASFCCGKKEVNEAVKVLEKLAGYDFDQLKAIEMYVAFGDATEEVLRFILGQSGSKRLIYPALFGYVQQIRLSGMSINDLLFASLAFKAREYGVAVELWEQQGKTQTNDYRYAKAAIEPYPESLDAFHAIKEWAQMVDQYRDHQDVSLSVEQCTMVCAALAHLNKYHEALVLLAASRSIEGLRAVEDIAKEAKNQAVKEVCHLGVLVLLVESGTWMAMPDLVKSKLSAKEALTLSRALARSDKLVSILNDVRAGVQIQKQISEFLRNRYIKPQLAEVSEQYVLEIGAAIERAGNRIDALQFYEFVEEGAFSPLILKQATQRWIVCKERQAKFNADRGVGERSPERMKEAEERRRQLGIANGKLPEFPILPKTLADLFDDVMKDKTPSGTKAVEKTVAEVAAGDEAGGAKAVIGGVATAAGQAVGGNVAAEGPASAGMPVRKVAQRSTGNIPKEAARKQADEGMKAKTEMTIGAYKITFFREHGRINIEHMESGEHLAIRKQGTEVEGDWEFEQPEPGRFKILGAEFDIVNDPDKGVALEFGKNGVVVLFERG